MNDLERCPRCFHLPEVTVDPNDRSITLSCPKHGHMAQGYTLEAATLHWNHYIAFLVKVA